VTVNAELFSVIRSRRSIRRFKDTPVPREILDQLLDCAAWAPSAGNRQDWLFIVITAFELKQAMADAVRQCWQTVVAKNGDTDGELATYTAGFGNFASAPVVIAVCARRVSDYQTRLMGETALVAGGSIVSAAMAAQNLMLAAQALGIGTCCMTGAVAARAELEALLGVGRRHELVCLVAAGYPAEQPPAPPRKPVAAIARFME
jgi:nitroreductase